MLQALIRKLNNARKMSLYLKCEIIKASFQDGILKIHKEKPRQLEITEESSRLYMRWQARVINHEVRWFVTIASIDIQAECQQRGIFAGLLDFAQENRIPIYVENSMNWNVDKTVLNKGFTRDPRYELDRCYYRLGE